MKILNLFSGIGGNRKLWGDSHNITAIEYNQKIADIYQANFPNDTVIVTDAHEYLLNHYKDFDFIWSSPPCQSHSKMVGQNQTPRYIDLALYQEIIFLDKYFKGLWVVENVKPYYTPLVPPKKEIGRHLFWSNFTIGYFKAENIKDFINLGTVNDTEKMKAWLGIKYEGNVYYEGNHCPAQVLRNAVVPETGQYILDCAMGIIRKQNTKQTELF